MCCPPCIFFFGGVQAVGTCPGRHCAVRFCATAFDILWVTGHQSYQFIDITYDLAPTISSQNYMSCLIEATWLYSKFEPMEYLLK